ncbi:MAG: GHKL domain-containing protein [Clostridium sp.]|nr:GHKL domain-containing protein [Clostridium sp.]
MKLVLDNIDLCLIAPFYFGYICAAGKFCKKYLSASKKNEILFVVLSFGAWLLWNIADRRYFFPYFFSAVPNIVFFVALVRFFQSDREKRILAVSVLIAAQRLSVSFGEASLSCLILFFRHTVGKIQEPFLSGWEIGLIGCADCCFAFLAVFWMSKHLEPVFCGKRGKWYVVLAVPLFMLIAVFDVAGWGASHGVMVRSGGNMGLYYDQIFSHVEFLVLAVLSMAATGFYVFGMNRIYLEQEKSSRYHSQIAVYKMLTEQYSQSERLRHDMKNHIIALSGLFSSQEWGKLGEYLKQLEENGLEAVADVTGSRAVDALLYQKRKWAKREAVSWECDIRMPKACGINEFDLCVLFGNILDNALEACGRQPSGESRFIRIQAGTVKKCFLLEVKNSMNRTETCREGFTEKENANGHGIGLLNVGDVVHKYNGVMHTETEDGIFVISILIPLKEAAHDIKQAV